MCLSLWLLFLSFFLGKAFLSIVKINLLVKKCYNNIFMVRKTLSSLWRRWTRSTNAFLNKVWDILSSKRYSLLYHEGFILYFNTQPKEVFGDPCG